ncbi:MAG TPA: glycosyltransferase family 2 protein [bacterium]|nr:glycosyltransferase family 2 protein [bacterium]
MPKIIVVLPVYNEEKHLPGLLPRLSPQADILVLVNDGSTDGSFKLLQAFVRKRKGAYLLDLPENRGMAGALEAGFLFSLYLKRMGQAGPEDLVVTIDADGQHKPEYIPKIAGYLAKRKADVVLTRRDFSVYPRYKVLGNRFLTWTNSFLSGTHYKDVESGLRMLKVRTLEPVLRYYTGVKYSCAQEIALLTARSGFYIDNDFRVEIAYYRPGTTFWDGFIVLGMSLFTFLRWVLRAARPVSDDIELNQAAFLRSRQLWGRNKRSGKR